MRFLGARSQLVAGSSGSRLNDILCRMIHAYHVILSTYGFRLPNDPRGSWSDFVGAWDLRRFGPATKGLQGPDQLSDAQRRWLAEAKSALKYPPVSFSGQQALSAARGFGNAVESNNYTIWACSILPEHVHIVVARHQYKVEQVVRLLKGAATRQLTADGIHPLVSFADAGSIPSPWAEGQWKVFLDNEEAIENAIQYVEENPLKEGKPRQSWSFVQPFTGLDHGWITYHT